MLQYLVQYISYSEGSKTRCFITNAFQLCFSICRDKGPGKPGVSEIKWDVSAAGPLLLLFIIIIIIMAEMTTMR
jgi:hypothetical protein